MMLSLWPQLRSFVGGAVPIMPTMARRSTSGRVGQRSTMTAKSGKDAKIPAKSVLASFVSAGVTMTCALSSTGFVNRWLRVQVPPLALETRRAGACGPALGIDLSAEQDRQKANLRLTPAQNSSSGLTVSSKENW